MNIGDLAKGKKQPVPGYEQLCALSLKRLLHLAHDHPVESRELSAGTSKQFCALIRQFWIDYGHVSEATFKVLKEKYGLRARWTFQSMEIDVVVMDVNTSMLLHASCVRRIGVGQVSSFPLSFVPAQKFATDFADLRAVFAGLNLQQVPVTTSADGHRLIGEITSQTDERDIAKKLLQLEKDCAYYVLKDLIFDNSVQVIAGQPLVLKEGGCPQLVLICPGNNNSTEGFIRSVLQRNQQHLPFVNAAASAGRLYLMFQEDVSDILTRLDSNVALLQDNVNYLVQRARRQDRPWHVKVREFFFGSSGKFSIEQLKEQIESFELVCTNFVCNLSLVYHLSLVCKSQRPRPKSVRFMIKHPHVAIFSRQGQK
ncbi:hypothetical protein MIR68_009922 [Amoeboaphelidium protococcarum]|nr:hypothetical protein MIR68_009922 [Amoeboaphelidium protococcarum]